MAGLAAQALQARREGRLDDARRGWSAAIELGRSEGRQVELAQALKGLGQIERDLGSPDSALGHYLEALAIVRDAHTLRHVGDIHFDAGRADLAETYLREAVAMCRNESTVAPLEMANAVRSLAAVTGERALWEEARSLYKTAGVAAAVEACEKRLA
jgi:tetratricopeptide (TPR) repeat protein